MLLQSAYINGHERRTFRAYEITLHPLTLGHIQLLAEMDCRIPWAGGNITREDIAMVVAVCAFPAWEQAREHMAEFPTYATDLAQKVLSEEGDESEHQVMAFVVYYLAKPANQNTFDLMEGRVPWWWSYAEFMQTEMHRSEVQAWATICCDAFAYCASFATRNGSEDFLTHREIYLAGEVQAGKTMKQLFEEGVI